MATFFSALYKNRISLDLIIAKSNIPFSLLPYNTPQNLPYVKVYTNATELHLSSVSPFTIRRASQKLSHTTPTLAKQITACQPCMKIGANQRNDAHTQTHTH